MTDTGHAPPDDLDTSRRAVAAAGLVPDASAHLTGEVAMQLPFGTLAPFKTLLKRFFSPAPWTDDDIAELDDIVTPHVNEGWWEHELGSGLTLRHGVVDGHYRLWVTGAGVTETESVFDRIFSGPVVPEATPHPRKVKFTVGGTPSPGVWFLRDAPAHDPRVLRLFEEPDVTDVMVAGDFVTVGLDRTSTWEVRLDPLLSLVTELFADTAADTAPAVRTRDELMAEGRSVPSSARADAPLHLADPDDPADRDRLLAALASDDARQRRIAVVVLAESAEGSVRNDALGRGATDSSLIVRRAAIDAAADQDDLGLAHLFVTALADPDPWLRWKAVRSLGDLSTHLDHLRPLTDDPDFQVRFEVARILRSS